MSKIAKKFAQILSVPEEKDESPETLRSPTFDDHFQSGVFDRSADQHIKHMKGLLAELENHFRNGSYEEALEKSNALSRQLSELDDMLLDKINEQESKLQAEVDTKWDR